jgi:hypothetical protein
VPLFLIDLATIFYILAAVLYWSFGDSPSNEKLAAGSQDGNIQLG